MGRQAVRTLKPQPAPAGIYDCKYTPGLAAEICARLAAGESLRSICRKDPSMPTEKTVWNWVQQRAAFALAYSNALTSARRRRREAAKARDAAARAGKAAARIARGWRPTPPWPDTYTPETADRICGRIAGGESLSEICESPDLPSIATVYNWLKRHGEFERAYRTARQGAAHGLLLRAVDGAPWLETDTASRRELARRERDAMRRLGHMWPRGFEGPPLRREICVRYGPRRPDGGRTLQVFWGSDRWSPF